MKISFNDYDKSALIELTDFDVETAIIQYICACHPEYNSEYSIDVVEPKACIVKAYKHSEG